MDGARIPWDGGFRFGPDRPSGKFRHYIRRYRIFIHMNVEMAVDNPVDSFGKPLPAAPFLRFA
jgi:hypothetical protein